MELFLLIVVIFVALIFTYTNGMNDTANAIATVVGTKVLTPRQAIGLAAVTNLIGSFFGLAVAKTISTGLVEQSYITQEVLICVIVSAILWNLLTWWNGLPSSSTHALVGSLVGGALAAAVSIHAAHPLVDKDGRPASPWSAVKWNETKTKIDTHLIPPSPELQAAVASKTWENGTHRVMLGEKPVRFVAFRGRIMEVMEIPKAERTGVLNKVVMPMITSPVAGFFLGLIVMAGLYMLLRSWRPVLVNRIFGRLQLASSAYMGFSHGMNDASKCMGIITIALVTGTKSGLLDHLPSWLHFLRTPEGTDPLHLSLGDKVELMLPSWLQFGYMPNAIDVTSQGVPDWVVIVCALTIALGTAVGGWRIIKTLGHKLVKLQPVHGFAAETTAATVLAITGSLGMPVSTTHAITTSIMGVGCAKRFSALKLKVVEKIVWAWILTIPATASVAFSMVWLGYAVGLIQFGK
jgi:PiT family inorganic phosphate transporter